MPLTNNISDYEAVRVYLDRALESPAGIKITLPSHGQAVHLRQKLYKLRQLETRASVDVFPVGDDRRGASPWDGLSIQVEKGSCELRILHQTPIRIEEL